MVLGCAGRGLPLVGTTASPLPPAGAAPFCYGRTIRELNYNTTVLVFTYYHALLVCLKRLTPGAAGLAGAAGGAALAGGAGCLAAGVAGAGAGAGALAASCGLPAGALAGWACLCNTKLTGTATDV